MKQQLIVFSGLPGSGKSTVALALARVLQLPFISVDKIESAIIESGFAKNFNTGLAAYLVARNFAVEQLKAGTSVVIDAVNAEEEAKDTWRALAGDHPVPLVVIETRLDESTHKARLESRIRGLYGLPEVSWDMVLARKKVYTAWKEATILIDTAEEISVNIGKLVTELQ